jgi:hypothetical protein
MAGGSPADPGGDPTRAALHVLLAAISQGEDVATVAAQMRHADPTTTRRVYTQVMTHTRQGVAERLDDALWGANGNSGRKQVASGDLRASVEALESRKSPLPCGSSRT